ncbi:MAG: globin family protein [Betaproteobacteria bacterium]
MTPQHIHLVRKSFLLVVPIATTAAGLFYKRLFELDPTLRHLFREDMTEQGAKLMAMLGTAVDLLDQPEKLLPALRALGQRHLAYGVEDGHYATVGNALLWTLETGLGPAYTQEVAAAWASVYGVIAAEMQSAAKNAFAAAL